MREDKRLARGVTYEPEMFVERRNWTAKALPLPGSKIATMPTRQEEPLTNIAAARVAVEVFSEASAGD